MIEKEPSLRDQLLVEIGGGPDTTDDQIMDEIVRRRIAAKRCERDAERYRWIREFSHVGPGVPIIMSFDHDGGEDRLDGERADRAIDDARAGEKKT